MMDVGNSDKKAKRPIIFLGVGALNTLIDFSFYTILTLSVFKNGNGIALAGFISGTVALFFAFVMHSLITWRGSNISHKTFIKFFVATGIGMWLIRPFLLAQFIHLSGLYTFAHILTHNLHLPFNYNFIANTGAFGFMVIIVLVYNYYVYEKFVFTKKKPTSTAQETR